MIASGSLAKIIVPLIHSMPQVDAIYIFCGDKRRHEQWARVWPKIKGVYTRIEPICETIQPTVKQYKQEPVGMSFAKMGEEGATDRDPNELDPDFMYSQLFKNAFLGMELDKVEFERAKQDLATYCRKRYAKVPEQLELIDMFEQD